jgi:pyruvate dehydrogenase E1 component alpha subunit
MIRFFGHFEGDQQTYRGKGEVEDIRTNRDCIKAFAAKVIEAGVIQRAELDAIDKEVVSLIDEAVAHAKAAPAPSPKDLMSDVYVAY